MLCTHHAVSLPGHGRVDSKQNADRRARRHLWILSQIPQSSAPSTTSRGATCGASCRALSGTPKMTFKSATAGLRPRRKVMPQGTSKNSQTKIVIRSKMLPRHVSWDYARCSGPARICTTGSSKASQAHPHRAVPRNACNVQRSSLCGTDAALATSNSSAENSSSEAQPMDPPTNGGASSAQPNGYAERAMRAPKAAALDPAQLDCGDGCLNRQSFLHCDAKLCPCGTSCRNKCVYSLPLLLGCQGGPGI